MHSLHEGRPAAAPTRTLRVSGPLWRQVLLEDATCLFWVLGSGDTTTPNVHQITFTRVTIWAQTILRASDLIRRIASQAPGGLGFTRANHIRHCEYTAEPAEVAAVLRHELNYSTCDALRDEHPATGARLRAAVDEIGPDPGLRAKLMEVQPECNASTKSLWLADLAILVSQLDSCVKAGATLGRRTGYCALAAGALRRNTWTSQNSIPSSTTIPLGHTQGDFPTRACQPTFTRRCCCFLQRVSISYNSGQHSFVLTRG